MDYKILGPGQDIAYLDTGALLITDAGSALDLMMTAHYETGCRKLILQKGCVTDGFFILSTGMAGDILQKFVNYHIKVAIIGDYSKYTSKPLRDFIYESNNGRDIFFLSSMEEAVEKLSRV